MNKRERLHAAFKRERTDRIPIALWRHFPTDDQSAQGLAERVIAFQKEYDFDFVKVTPAAGYPAEMYGAPLTDAGNREGTRVYAARPVPDWTAWNSIHALDTTNPVFQREREAIRLVRAGVGPDVPVLQTIFSPLTCCKNLRGNEVVKDLREHPAELHRALAEVTETTIRFALNCVEAGADAMFFATQLATNSWTTKPEYLEFGEKYDRLILEALRGRVDFVLLHGHGEGVYFNLLAQYPVECINWHDRKTPPPLKEARVHFRGALAGGIDEWDVLAPGTPEQIRTQIQEAIEQTERRGLILAPGCVISTDTPAENIRAARDAVETA